MPASAPVFHFGGYFDARRALALRRIGSGATRAKIRLGRPCGHGQVAEYQAEARKKTDRRMTGEKLCACLKSTASQRAGQWHPGLRNLIDLLPKRGQRIGSHRNDQLGDTQFGEASELIGAAGLVDGRKRDLDIRQ